MQEIPDEDREPPLLSVRAEMPQSSVQIKGFWRKYGVLNNILQTSETFILLVFKNTYLMPPVTEMILIFPCAHLGLTIEFHLH